MNDAKDDDWDDIQETWSKDDVVERFMVEIHPCRTCNGSGHNREWVDGENRAEPSYDTCPSCLGIGQIETRAPVTP